MITIKEIIVVEGRDDTAAIHRAVDAQTIETHGFGMSDAMWEQIDKAVKSRGIIVFTDPDYAGEKIRRKIRDRYPGCKEAFVPRTKATRKGNIGVENAAPEAIREALLAARCTEATEDVLFTMADLTEAGMAQGAGSKEKRERVGNELGIGYGNCKTLLSKLNGFGITKEEFYEAVRSISDPGHQE